MKMSFHIQTYKKIHPGFLCLLFKPYVKKIIGQTPLHDLQDECDNLEISSSHDVINNLTNLTKINKHDNSYDSSQQTYTPNETNISNKLDAIHTDHNINNSD